MLGNVVLMLRILRKGWSGMYVTNTNISVAEVEKQIKTSEQKKYAVPSLEHLAAVQQT